MIPVIRVVQTLVSTNGRQSEDSEFVLESNEVKLFMCRDLFYALGIFINQISNFTENSTVNAITT